MFPYCVKHEHSTMLQHSYIGDCHEYPVYSEFGLEYDWCFYELGYAYCEPPEEYPDWDLDEPSQEELAEMEEECY